MNILQKSLNKIAEKILQKSTFFSREGRPMWLTGKYAESKGNLKEYSESYKEELYIYGCVYLISNTIAALPLIIYKDELDKKTGKPIKKPIPHPAYLLLNKPNFRDSTYDIKESVSANLELTGNGYLLLDQLVGDKPTSIYSLISSKVNIEKNESAKTISKLEDMIKYYEYGDIKYGINDIIHERKFNPTDDIIGMSPIQAGALTIDTTIEAKKQNYQIFKNGMNPDGMFTTEQGFNEIADKRVKEMIKTKHQGNERSHDPMFLWNGLKYQPIGIPPKDLEYIQGLKLSREELCGFLYQVPIILLGILENSSYNNIKEAIKIFYNVCIRPRLVKNQELWQKLIDIWKVEGAYIEYDLSGVEALKEEQGAKVTRAKDLFSIGVPVNIINDMLELGIPQYNGWDRGYLPFSLSPVGSAGIEQPQGPTGQESVNIVETKKNKLQMTEDQKRKKWDIFKDFTEKIEKEYGKSVRKIFFEQEQEVIDNLEKLKSISAIRENGMIKFVNEQKITIDIDEVIFNEKTYRIKYKDNSVKYYKESINQSAQNEIDTFDLGFMFDVDNPRVKEYIAKEGLRNAKSVMDTAKDSVRQAIVNGVNEGESVKDIIERIKLVYDAYDNEYALERIVRTEVIGASNFGALESYRQSGVVEKKAWLTTYDDRTRDTHIQAGQDYNEDKAIKIDDEFEVGGEGLQAPGQGNLPENNINCRCTVIPVVEE